ncbi:MAG: galactonate dehydratase [Pseudonocardiales bacterium]|nr:MAG: galactonate dehydratase [Pseudonocardiales bacterium]
MSDAVVVLHRDDDVAVATRDVTTGSAVSTESRTLTTRGDIPRGHKIAVRDIAAGSPVRKYGQPIGVATNAIAAGEHVHTHNLGMPDGNHDLTVGSANARHTSGRVSAEVPTFDGIRRPDGRAATRNYLLVLSTVNCSATVAKRIAAQAEARGLLDEANGVDGIFALTHGTGCGMASDGDGMAMLRRSLAGYAHHPNVGGVLIMGLGCEVNQVSALSADLHLPAHVPVRAMTIQELGGSPATVREGLTQVEQMLGVMHEVQRGPMPVSELVLGLQCGGSDGWSGLTANPALGVASDLLVEYGGTSILGETPEIYGAEHLLLQRAVSDEVGQRLIDRIRWWERYTADNGASMDNNPSPGNKAGGLTTILEKSLGAVAKAGRSPLRGVYEYGELVTEHGLVFMDTPGYDPVSVTGMVAGGANIVCFTTGRGSVFGCKPVPSLKLATNSDVYRRMPEDMDIDCGTIVEQGESLDAAGARIFQRMIGAASGQATASEELGFGDEEFVPWQLGAVM